MKVVIQRVLNGGVKIEGRQDQKIGQGYVVLVAFEELDDQADLEWMLNKVLKMRLFADEVGKMNLSLEDVGGELLLISQFTLYANTKKGTRPSFIKAASPKLAEERYDTFKLMLADQLGDKLKSGIFGADMKVSLINDGPVTIQIDSKNKG